MLRNLFYISPVMTKTMAQKNTVLSGGCSALEIAPGNRTGFLVGTVECVNWTEPKVPSRS
jgi:hypothetical protein